MSDHSEGMLFGSDDDPEFAAVILEEHDMNCNSDSNSSEDDPLLAIKWSTS